MGSLGVLYVPVFVRKVRGYAEHIPRQALLWEILVLNIFLYSSLSIMKYQQLDNNVAFAHHPPIVTQLSSDKHLGILSIQQNYVYGASSARAMRSIGTGRAVSKCGQPKALE